MIEKQSEKEQQSHIVKSTKDLKEVDLMKVLFRIISIRKTLYKAAGVGLVLGIIVALSIPRKYTVKVTLSPEMGVSKGNNGLAGLAASFLGNGANVEDASDALNASLSADIVSSTPFLLELFGMDVSTSVEETNLTLEAYLDEQKVPWWSYILGLPGMMVTGVKSLFTDDEAEITSNTKRGAIELTKEEAKKISFLKKNITAFVDKKTAITEISVVLQDPKVTAIVADSVAQKLQEYIINYRTFKAKEDCAYLEKLFKERQDEYYVAQKKYADYVDTHDNLILQSVRAEQERLQNDMSLAYQVYSQVANQLQVARAKVQEEKPVFAIVEPAVVPRKPSGFGMKIYMLLFIFCATVGTVIWMLLGKEFWDRLRNGVVN